MSKPTSITINKVEEKFTIEFMDKVFTFEDLKDVLNQVVHVFSDEDIYVILKHYGEDSES